MVAGLAKSELQTSYKAGVGKVREHTLVLGAQVIALDNIGSIRFFESVRSWWLAFVGLLATGGAGSQVPLYGPLAWAGVGLGIVLVLINMLAPIERGLLIGISDGRTAMIISKDAAFLRRLLDLLTEKINSRNEALIASFDISNSTIHAGEDNHARPIPQMQQAPVATTLAGDAAHAAPAATSNRNPDIAIASGAPASDHPGSAPDIDEALFASEPEPRLKTPTAPERVALASAQRTAPHDPMLDGPSIAPPRAEGNPRDWLDAPGGFAYEGDQNVRPGPMRWMLPILFLAILAGGAVAAWMVLRNPDGAMSISLMTPTTTSPVESMTLADALADTAAPAASAEPATAPDPAAFTPSEPIVARTSGQRYRERPFSTDDVPVLAETRFGGEALMVNGHVSQTDGEWYRVALSDGRMAWFKAALAIPQARFAETLAASSVASASFVESSPRILEPAEGVQFSGGEQSIRLAWTGNDSATAYLVEIQSFDSAVQRWATNAPPRRLTIPAATEIAETFAVGAWRWRVRGVSADGEQSQLSRWAAFGVRE